MKTLYEKILKAGVSETAQAELKDTTIINADNIEAYYVQTKSDWGSASDFPNVMPPFETTFIEFRIAAEDAFPGEISEFIGGQRVGILLKRKDLKAPDAPAIPKDIAGHVEETDMRWLVEAQECFEVAGNPIVFPHGNPWSSKWVYGVTSTGGIVIRPDGTPHIDILQSLAGNLLNKLDPGNDIAESSANQSLYVAMLALSFIHCKNVSLETNLPTAHQGKRDRHGSRPAYPYHTIKIHPLATRKVGGGVSVEDRNKPSVFIRRGHFKTYTQEAPLFGQHVGTYWWESAVVGKGETPSKSDYEVLPPGN